MDGQTSGSVTKRFKAENKHEGGGKERGEKSNNIITLNEGGGRGE